MGALALAGMTLGAAAPSAQAMPRLAQAVNVPCDAATLATAIQTANGAGVATLFLAPNCIYNYSTATVPDDALPIITGDIALVGGLNTTIRRDPAAPGFRILEVASGATLRVQRVSIVGGSTTGFGGGISNAGTVVLDHTILSGNQAANGGAFANLAGSNAMISHSVLKENAAGSIGGGAVINFGTLTLSGVILTKNTAPINGGALNTQPGGVSNLIKGAVQNNTAGGLGGGISNLGTVSLDGTVVGQNRGSGGGGIATGNADVTLRKSIVNDNFPDNCSPLNTIPGCVN
ncbi:hypothetical protein [Planotetraspora mira]|nr:hypothetical protein [Planotetraspora mira]